MKLKIKALQRIRLEGGQVLGINETATVRSTPFIRRRLGDRSIEATEETRANEAERTQRKKRK